jgi:hypothetical protein
MDLMEHVGRGVATGVTQQIRMVQVLRVDCNFIPLVSRRESPGGSIAAEEGTACREFWCTNMPFGKFRGKKRHEQGLHRLQIGRTIREEQGRRKEKHPLLNWMTTRRG